MFWVQTHVRTIFGNTFHGATFSFLMEESFTHLCLQPCAGLYGIAETKLPLNKEKLKTPFAVIYSACGFISYWAGMMTGADRGAMERGAKMLRASASNMMRICAASGEMAQD